MVIHTTLYDICMCLTTRQLGKSTYIGCCPENPNGMMHCASNLWS